MNIFNTIDCSAKYFNLVNIFIPCLHISQSNKKPKKVYSKATISTHCYKTPTV